MRKFLSIAIVVMGMLFALSAQAQRGVGGRAGGVGMGGRGAGPVMGARAGGPVMGARSVGPVMGGRGVAGRGFVAPSRVGPTFTSGRRAVVRPGVPSRRLVAGGFGVNHFRPFGFGGRCFNGFPCNNPFFFHNRFLFNDPFFFGFGLGFPFYPYSYIPGFDTGYYGVPQQEQPVVAPDNSNNSNDIQLAMQLQRLSDEVESMREEQRQANAARTSGASLSAREPAAATTFVFRDGNRISTPNYAIAGQTLWILSEHMARRVALSELDVEATQQANAANGIDLHLPEPLSR